MCVYRAFHNFIPLINPINKIKIITILFWEIIQNPQNLFPYGAYDIQNTILYELKIQHIKMYLKFYNGLSH